MKAYEFTIDNPLEYVLTGKFEALSPNWMHETMELIAKQAINEKLSVRAVEGLVKKLHEPKKPAVEKKTDAHLADLQGRLQDKFQTKVSLDNKQLVIHYHGYDDLNRILDCLDAED